MPPNKRTIEIDEPNEETGLVSGKRTKLKPNLLSSSRCLLLVALLASFGLLVRAIIFLVSRKTPEPLPDISVAFVGNSMLYYNDMPRFLEGLSGGHLTQNSCLHGDASLFRILKSGNGMYEKFNTTNGHIQGDIFDFGTCTVPQLLLGYDDKLNEQVKGSVDPYLLDDGSNPCLQDHNYSAYLDEHLARNPHWDFIIINDNTRNPGRAVTRAAGLRVLQQTYLPWILQTGATPIFLVTHAYWTPARNLSGFVDVPTFTSLTYEGYLEYAEMLAELLPDSQKPLLAPSGIAFLVVWEENRDLWKKMFHSDYIHASPVGSFLQGCVLYYTLYGRMPRKELVLLDDMSVLWSQARVMQQAGFPPNPFPSREEAEYLYGVADRVMRKHYFPASFISYDNNEAAPGGEQEFRFLK